MRCLMSRLQQGHLAQRYVHRRSSLVASSMQEQVMPLVPLLVSEHSLKQQ